MNITDKNMEKLTLSNSQYVFGGVCGGLAEYFEVDPVFIRLGFLLFGFIEPFTTTLVYTLLYFLMPDKTPNEKSREVREMKL